MAIYGNTTSQETPYKTTHGKNFDGRGNMLGWWQKLSFPGDARINQVSFYIKADWPEGHSYTANVDFWNGAGVWLASTFGVNGVGGEAWSWHTAPIYTAPGYVDVIGGDQYYVFVRSNAIDDSYCVRWAFNNSVSNNQQYHSATTSPVALPGSFTYTGNFCIYYTYTPTGPWGPNVKIEGLFPGKLEYTSWNDISDVL